MKKIFSNNDLTYYLMLLSIVLSIFSFVSIFTSINKTIWIMLTIISLMLYCVFRYLYELLEKEK